MEEARQKADEDARKEAASEKEKPAAAGAEREADGNRLRRQEHRRQRKTINGFDTHEAIMTITVREKGKTLEQSGGMVMTSDMWLAPKIAAMKEVRRLRHALRAEAVRPDDRRRFRRADGRGDGDVSDDEAGARHE